MWIKVSHEVRGSSMCVIFVCDLIKVQLMFSNYVQGPLCFFCLSKPKFIMFWDVFLLLPQIHSPGAKRIKLDTPEEIAKWREERRKWVNTAVRSWERKRVFLKLLFHIQQSFLVLFIPVSLQDTLCTPFSWIEGTWGTLISLNRATFPLPTSLGSYSRLVSP